jgi:Protein of unknown function (DUF1553)/Protein of unknown function (DUF1549)
MLMKFLPANRAILLLAGLSLFTVPATASGHWAYQPTHRPEVPRVRNTAWVVNPVDAFIAAKYEERGLVPAPEAPRRVLIRRLSLDLLGLPPTPAKVDAFVKDSAPDAYERLVDRLLASPAYGERWGRHWLDLARWAESEGYESNHLRPFAWRYRDHVVRAFNEDKPFAEFVRQQVAGDEMLPYRDENLIATGFLAAARQSSNEEDKWRQRNDLLVDVANATANTFLGITLNCAQCHNHKFDAFSARDYYRFLGFFIKGQPARLVLRDPALTAAYQKARPEGYQQAVQQQQAIFEKARRRLIEERRKNLSAEQLRALAIPTEKRTDEEERLAREADLKFQFTPNRIEKAIEGPERKTYEKLKARIAEMEKGMPDRPQTFGFYSPATSPTPVEIIPMKGFYPLPYVPEELAQARSHLLIGGDVHRRGPAVGVGWPKVLGPTPDEAVEKSPRLALADWLTSPKNPLVSRVWVNRVWQHHFGRGIVATPSNFGVKGTPPTHPELLDWLASEFQRSGGSTKHLHRLIVLSRTYRQASHPHAGNEKLDPENLYLWHWRPRRLEAETIRDSLLAVSGELDRTPGGPSDTDEQTLRRSLYLFQKRDQPPQMQGLFDGPSAVTESCPKRFVSTVPLQALYLVNNDFVLKRAEALARRILAQSGTSREQQVEAAFRFTLGRTPLKSEQAAARRFFATYREPSQALVHFCHALLNLNEFVYLE